MIIKAIALRFGYVESNSLSWLVFAQDPYESIKIAHSKKEALHSLVEFLFKKFNPPIKGPRNKCCQKSLKASKENEFCSKCGSSLKKLFPVLDWEEFLQSFLQCDIDGFGYSDGVENPYGWDAPNFSFGIPDHQMVIIPQNAAQTLTLALFEIHPELKEIADEVPEDNDKNYIWRDYQELLGNTVSEDNHKNIMEEVIEHHPNCVKVAYLDGELNYIMYNTGDIVYFRLEDGEYKWRGHLTHDGIHDGDISAG